MRQFHESKARMRCPIGGRGSGKTTGVSVEALGHCLWNAGARVMILRKTQDSNDETTLKTFEEVFDNCGMVETETSLFKKIEGGRRFRIPSLLAIQKYNEFLKVPREKGEKLLWIKTVGEKLCGEVGFAGIPTAQFRSTKLRGFECSLLVFVEADQLEKDDLNFGEACLRWKGADPEKCDHRGFIKDMGIILDTNPPGTTHWIAELEKRKCADTDVERRKKWNKPGKIDCGPDLVFWHIPTHENKPNLPDKYVENLEERYADNPSMFERMLLGMYSDAEDGQRVFHKYQPSKHAFEELPFPRGAYLVRGWDFGTTSAVIFSAYWAEGDDDIRDEYWWDLAELYLEQSDTEEQCRAVLRMTEEMFPFWNDRAFCQGILDYCDPAGAANKDTGSSLKVLGTHGIHPGYSRVGLAESIALYNRFLEKKDRHGNFVYRLDKNSCPRLHRASSGGYRYAAAGEVGYDSNSNQPLKGPKGGNFDHLADAARYAKMGCLRLLRSDAEKANAAVGILGRKISINPRRRYY